MNTVVDMTITLGVTAVVQPIETPVWRYNE